jgi:hypothetical protein
MQPGSVTSSALRLSLSLSGCDIRDARALSGFHFNCPHKVRNNISEILFLCEARAFTRVVRSREKPLWIYVEF